MLIIKKDELSFIKDINKHVIVLKNISDSVSRIIMIIFIYDIIELVVSFIWIQSYLFF